MIIYWFEPFLTQNNYIDSELQFQYFKFFPKKKEKKKKFKNLKLNENNIFQNFPGNHNYLNNKKRTMEKKSNPYNAITVTYSEA